MISNLNQSSAVDPTQSQNLSPAQKSRKSRSSEEVGVTPDEPKSQASFDQKLLQAGAVVSAQANAPQQPAQVSISKNALGLGTKAQASEKAEAQPKAYNVMSNSAEYSPLTAKSASGVSAGSSIAGPKPWNQDWVFEGMEHPSSEDGAFVRPLIGGKSAVDEIAEAREALKQLNALSEDDGEVASVAPGANQVKNLRLGGGGELKQAEPNSREDALVAVNARLSGQLPQQLSMQGGLAANAPLSSNDQAIAQAIAKMNGQIHGMAMNAARGRNALPQLSEGKFEASPAMSGGLSGSEFMNTLTLVKPGANAETVEAIGNRPSLQVIQGLGENTKKPGSEFNELTLAPGFGATMNHSPNLALNAAPMAQVTGHVVPGAMTQDQLSHEAILNVTNGIRNLGQGTGEMKIRLKPDNLGELHLKVMTRGQEVGLQIQASDENAKKILQDSISSLKDSLATQNLSLGKIELTVAKTLGGSDAFNQQSGHESRQQSQQQFDQSRNNQQAFSMLGQNAGQQSQSFNRWANPEGGADEGGQASPLKTGNAQARAALAAGQASSANRLGEGRLDVLA